MLGDGRAILLGEHLVNNDNRFDIQFKGSGRTSFSRGGDGRAALGPMLREYIISEAIHSLNIPTTRSLAVVKNRRKSCKRKSFTRCYINKSCIKSSSSWNISIYCCNSKH